MFATRFAWRAAPALFLAVFLTACGGSTKQPAVDPKVLEERLNAIVQSVTETQPGAELTAKADGKVNIETKDDGTVIGTFPRISFTGKDGANAVLENVSIKFMSGDEGQTPFEITVPSSFTVKDKDGKVVGEAKIGSQTLKGVWVEKLQTIDNVDMHLSNVSISAPGEEGSGKVQDIALTGKLQPTGGGLYDGKYDLRVTGFSVDDPAQKDTFKMATLAITSTLSGAKMEEFAKAALEAGYTLKNPNIFKVWTGGSFDPKMIAFLKRMPEFMGTINYTYNVDGIEATHDGKTEFMLHNASFGFGAGGDGAGQTKVRLTAGLGGMGTGADAPLLPPEADVQDAAVEFEASGVPGRQLWDIYVDALPAIQAEAKRAAESAATAATAQGQDTSSQVEQLTGEMSMKFMQVLSTAKLAIALNKMNLTTPTAKMTGKGDATYLPAEQMLPVGKFAFRFSGLEALAKAMEKRGKDDEMAQQVMGYVSAVRAMGKPDPASAPNDPAYIIEIEITKDGKILSNGQDMSGAAGAPG
ncbi:MAG: hypothetical protein GC190_17430 [Alphaproteobacteria bacterium]|nr:hypothetical protein [Alphaproteobacteria bacterium]